MRSPIEGIGILNGGSGNFNIEAIPQVFFCMSKHDFVSTELNLITFGGYNTLSS